VSAQAATKKRPRAKKPTKKTLTARERRLIKALATAPSHYQALIEAGYPESTAKGASKRTIDTVVGKCSNSQKLMDALDKAGIDETKLAEKHAEGLEAYKVISAVVMKTGKGAGKHKDADAGTHDFVEVPDFPARHKHVDTLHKIRGDFAKEELDISGDVTIEIVNYAGDSGKEKG
jgi:hypothetical protein